MTESQQDKAIPCYRCARTSRFVVKIPRPSYSAASGTNSIRVCARHAVWYKRNGYAYEVVP